MTESCTKVDISRFQIHFLLCTTFNVLYPALFIFVNMDGTFLFFLWGVVSSGISASVLVARLRLLCGWLILFLFPMCVQLRRCFCSIS